MPRFRKAFLGCLPYRAEDRFFTKIASRIAAFAGQPVGFVIALFLIIVWGACGSIFHYSDTWQLIVNTSTTIVTILMGVPDPEQPESRWSGHAGKLDEIIRALDDARSQFIEIEHQTDGENQKIRADLQEECDEDGKAANPNGKRLSIGF